jgi:hypothetical protein
MLRDFDAFWSEQDDQTMPIRFEGTVYQVPSSPPAGAALRALRLKRSDVKTVSPDEVFELANGVLGAANVEAMTAHNPSLSITKLMGFVGWVTEQQAAALAPPPNRATRREQHRRSPSTSSKAGRSSRRTSSASTGSTLAPISAP